MQVPSDHKRFKDYYDISSTYQYVVSLLARSLSDMVWTLMNQLGTAL